MINFKINNTAFISLPTENVPTPDDSLNYVNILYQSNDQHFQISNSVALEVTRAISYILKKALDKSLHLDASITPYNMGYLWNIDNHIFWSSDDTEYNNRFDSHWLFSIRGIQTFIYNVDNKIIIEISPSYKWNTCDSEEGEIVPTFESFMLLYKPIAIHEISKETAQEWIKQADEYLAIVEPQFEAWSKQPGEHQQQLYRLKEDA